MNIIGKSECTASQMAQYLINKNPNAKTWALEYAKLYLEEGEAEGVRGDGAWIQSCKETGNFMFIGGTAVTFDQNNFCGLGVTRKGLKGHSFETPRLGVRAQIQHLKGYATSAPLKNPCIDPRYKYVSKGCAPRFEDLAGKWAVPGYNTNLASSLQDAMNKGIGYGFDIIAGVEQMKKISISNTITTPTNIKTYIVGLDRGHGLKTSGKQTPDGIKEWTLNDAVADKVVELLSGYNVKFIHTDNDEGNVDESLGSRRSMYVNQKVDAFVSIHHNAHTGTWNNATGVEVYTDRNPTSQDVALANAIYKNLSNYTGLRGRGIKEANFAVINQNSVPAVLVEGGFMDGTNDYKVITSQTGQLGYAKAVAEGLIAFLGLVKITNTSSSTTITPSPITPSITSNIMKPTVRVNTTLNVRNKPNGTIIGKLTNGTEVDIIDHQNGWLKIGADRWVSGEYINNRHGRVTASVLNIRNGAGTKYKDIGDLKSNEVVRIFEESNGWYKVLSNSQKFGWVSSKYIDLI